MIGCNEYDLVELACLFNYTVKLTSKNKPAIEGKAKTVVHNTHLNECIIITNDGKQTMIELESLVKLEVLTEKAQFSEIVFETT